MKSLFCPQANHHLLVGAEENNMASNLQHFGMSIKHSITLGRLPSGSCNQSLGVQSRGLSNRSKIITNLAMAPESFRTVQDMVEDGKIDSVPKNYICREEDRWRPELSDGELLAPELPLIDLEGSMMGELGERRRIVVQQIRDACKDWGFFQVENHGVPLPLMKRMQQVARQVVELPADEKARIKQPHDIKDLNHAEGYKTRIASEGKVSHWSDRLRLHVFPVSSRNYNCWPTSPASFR